MQPNQTSRETVTAIQVEEVGLPLRLKEGTQSAKIGVRKMSKPAIKPTLEAEEVAMPLKNMFIFNKSVPEK